ncbi:MAG: hypothetical protein FWG41_00530 [Methanomassiliicoccaceae archaeon]|nr:hypothetical protein [Methanomassiliicoccaceae archaeon]
MMKKNIIGSATAIALIFSLLVCGAAGITAIGADTVSGAEGIGDGPGNGNSPISSVEINGQTLNVDNRYLVNNIRSGTGNLGEGNCTAEFNPSTGTLFLQGYTGGPIQVNGNGDIIISLAGTNIITAISTTDHQSGIKYHNGSGTVTITSSSGGVLDISVEGVGAEGITNSSSGEGVGDIVIGNSANVTVKTKSGMGHLTYGLSSVGSAAGGGNIIIKDSASLNVVTETVHSDNGTTYCLYAKGSISINTTGTVTLDASKNTGNAMALCAIKGFALTKASVLTLKWSGADGPSLPAKSSWNWNESDFFLTAPNTFTSIYIWGSLAGILTFTGDPAYNIPASTVGTAIADIDVSGGVSGGIVPYTFTASGLPAGISISPAGTISGTPTAAGPAGTATIIVTDSESSTNSITISYGAISEAPVPLTFTKSPGYDIPSSIVGTAISNIDVSGGAAGGTAPYTFTASGLPAGISISPAGTISGTPTAARAAGSATITVTDSESNSQSIIIAYGTITVPLTFMNNLAYDIPASAAGTAIANIDLSQGVSGGTAPYTFTATGLPEGVTISAAGVISGTPSAESAAGTITVTVTDSASNSQTFTVGYGAVSAPAEGEGSGGGSSLWIAGAVVVALIFAAAAAMFLLPKKVI